MWISMFRHLDIHVKIQRRVAEAGRFQQMRIHAQCVIGFRVSGMASSDARRTSRLTFPASNSKELLKMFPSPPSLPKGATPTLSQHLGAIMAMAGIDEIKKMVSANLKVHYALVECTDGPNVICTPPGFFTCVSSADNVMCAAGLRVSFLSKGSANNFAAACPTTVETRRSIIDLLELNEPAPALQPGPQPALASTDGGNDGKGENSTK